jgi:hypothetical protein
MPKPVSALALVCTTLIMCLKLNAASSNDAPNPCASTTVGFHAAVCTPDGNLALPLSFSDLEDGLLRAVAWYQASPLNEHGFPPVVRSCPALCLLGLIRLLQVHSTFVDGAYKSTGVTIDAAMQNGLGLLSYVKLHLRTNSSEHLNFAALFARYLIHVRSAPLCTPPLICLTSIVISPYPSGRAHRQLQWPGIMALGCPQHRRAL